MSGTGNLVAEGRRRIEWAASQMPVLEAIRSRWCRERPLAGVRLAACLHVTTETANLMLALRDGGAEVYLCGSNPLSTQDDVAAALNGVYGVATYARRGESVDEYFDNIDRTLAAKPHLTMDDGADLTARAHTAQRETLEGIVGGTEETTTGVIRLRAMSASGDLKYPVIAVNDARTKQMFDNRYGTGQSTLDGLLRATNMLLAGKVLVVAGYGWCGKGVAMRARGMGARVIVTEVDPLRALEAVMDGFQVMPMLDAARTGDVFVTVTGNRGVIGPEHYKLMKDGAILANSGHFDVEIDVAALKSMAASAREVREHVVEYKADGRALLVVSEGRLVNLAAAEGHPASVMDMSFADQALAAAHLWGSGRGLPAGVHALPAELDASVAALKLSSMGVRIDRLSDSQVDYITSWRHGTGA